MLTQTIHQQPIGTRALRLQVVSLFHPGSEHRESENGLKAWNNGSHRRKFVECVGQTSKGTQLLRFWAEWEPPSVVRRIDQPIENGPRFVHEPLRGMYRANRNYQNTDPLVFGGFNYAVCQQTAQRSHITGMQQLDVGSMILFGSHIAGHFVLDTAFVVALRVPYNADNYRVQLSQVVSEEILEVVARPLFENQTACNGDGRTRDLIWYVGATIDQPVHGMYSFFPCVAAEKCPRGFARPSLSEQNQKQGRRMEDLISLADVEARWLKVKQQVQSQNCEIGTYAKFPRAPVS